MKKLLVSLILLSVLICNKGFSAQHGTVTFNNVNLSINPNNPTHSPGFTMPATATGFDVIITTNPVWANMAGQGSLHLDTEVQLSSGTWTSIGCRSEFPYGSLRKDGTPQASYGCGNASDYQSANLRVTAWSDIHIVVQVVGSWTFE